MKRFRADSLTFTLPESWSEVTLDQFIKVHTLHLRNDSLTIIGILSGLSVKKIRQAKAYDLDTVVMSHLEFLKEWPVIPGIPKSLLINGNKVELPTDLGSEVDCGQMWDVGFVIRERQNEQTDIDYVSMASTLLPVFLWGKMREQPYESRHEAAELWDSIKTVNCLDGLAASAFFLRNSLKPLPSGKISVETIRPTRWSKWRQIVSQALPRLIRTTLQSN